MSTSAGPDNFIPALRFRALTRFYDGLLRTLLKEEAFKERLLRQASIQPGHHVLDLGCGTATLTIMAKRAHPEASVFGLDADSEVLGIARTKADEGGVAVDLRCGLASEPHFDTGTFDRVLSSLVFHHLTTDDKRRALVAARKLLRPGGEIHIADWGRAQNVPMRVAFLAVQLLDGFATTTDNVRGRLPDLMAEAGFRSVEETHREMTLFGTLALYRGVAAP
jgi:ubiquinone/menaquinone biosynthesis C-methylase UbiE